MIALANCSHTLGRDKPTILTLTYQRILDLISKALQAARTGEFSATGKEK
jgi:hypothetical protein